jgi:hypothetical protein
MPDKDQPQRDELTRWATDDLECQLETLKQEGIEHLRSLRKDGRPAHGPCESGDGLPQLARAMVRQLQNTVPSLTQVQALEIVEKAFAKVFNEAFAKVFNENMVGTVVEKKI